MKYQSLEAKKLWKEIKTEEKKNEVNGHGCSFEIDESEFFDAYENLPVYREEFFDCLEKFESENYDNWTKRDLLDLDGTYRDRVVVDCCGTLTSQHPTSDLAESTTELESNLALSDLALSELIGNTMICPVVNNAMSQWIMTVIFDTVASLHDDFRGDTVVVRLTVRPIKNYRALKKGDARLVIHALYYELRINMACR
jgi:hypothetical protein